MSFGEAAMMNIGPKVEEVRKEGTVSIGGRTAVENSDI